MSIYTIYGKPQCKYCDMAKSLLKNKNLNFEYIDISSDETSRQWILDQGYRTIPQVYKGDEHIGGYEDLQGYL